MAVFQVLYVHLPPSIFVFLIFVCFAFLLIEFLHFCQIVAVASFLKVFKIQYTLETMFPHFLLNHI